jgi:hypothetical protein
MRADTGDTWGGLSQADQLPYQTELGATEVGADGEPFYVKTEAEAIRRDKFKRRGVFHYALLVNLMGGAYANASGIAWDDNLVLALGVTRDIRYTTGTLMHELGHHFGLHHSGDTATPNYEPNYLSVMNYSLDGGIPVRGSRDNVYDYSRFSSVQVPDVDERNLDEYAGAVAHGRASEFYTWFYCPNTGDPKMIAFNAPVDWNCQDGITSGVLPPTSINKDAVTSVLTAHDDWTAIQLGLRIGPQRLAMADADSPTASDRVPMEEPHSPGHFTRRMPYDAKALASPDQEAAPGSSVVYTITVKNIGMFAIETEQAVDTRIPWVDISQVPTYLSLDENEETTFTLTVHIPETAQPGDVHHMWFNVLSRGSRQAMSSASIHTTVIEGVSVTADAGADLVVPCSSAAGTPVTLDGRGSNGPAGVALDYAWTGTFGNATGMTPTVAFPLGTSTATLTVSDGTRHAQDTQQVTVHVAVSGLAPPLAALVEEAQPIVLPEHALKQGRTLPLKLSLRCGTTPLTPAEVSAPRIVGIEREGTALPLETLDVDAGQSNDSGNTFRASEGQWVYNLDTTALRSGTYRLTLALPDGRRVAGGFVLR